MTKKSAPADATAAPQTTEQDTQEATQLLAEAKAKGFNPTTILALLALASQYGPMFAGFIQDLIDALKRPTPVGAAPAKLDHCPEEHKECCKKALAASLETTAHLCHICHCCEETT